MSPDHDFVRHILAYEDERRSRDIEDTLCRIIYPQAWGTGSAGLYLDNPPARKAPCSVRDYVKDALRALRGKSLI